MTASLHGMGDPGHEAEDVW